MKNAEAAQAEMEVEYSVPANAVLALREGNEERFTYDMILWNKAPEARICRVVAVVAHHKVVVHRKGVGCNLYAINEYFVAIHAQVVSLILIDNSLVEREVCN